MARRHRIRRKLTLTVSEPRQETDGPTPGERFADGWQAWSVLGLAGAGECGGDPVKIAGYLAAHAAFNAHHHAVNWMEVSA